VKPGFLMIISVGIYYFLHGMIMMPAWISVFVETVIWILVISCVYGGLLLMFHLNRKDNETRLYS